MHNPIAEQLGLTTLFELQGVTALRYVQSFIFNLPCYRAWGSLRGEQDDEK